MKLFVLLSLLFTSQISFAEVGYLPGKSEMRASVERISKRIEVTCDAKVKDSDKAQGCKYRVASQLYGRAFPLMIVNRNICKALTLESEKLCYTHELFNYDLLIEYRAIDRDFADVKANFCLTEVKCVDRDSRIAAKTLRNAVGTLLKANIQNKQLLRLFGERKAEAK